MHLNILKRNSPEANGVRAIAYGLFCLTGWQTWTYSAAVKPNAQPSAEG